MPQLPDILSGCKVFPILPGSKHPATENGWHDASSDPAQIAAWEAEFPGCNWAVATGLSGLFVLDIDPEGFDEWERIAARPEIREALDSAYIVHTPRGGLHIYFRGEGPSTASRIAPGIDTRGGMIVGGQLKSGGYVLLPGSRTADGTYTEGARRAIPDMPEAIRALVPERKQGAVHGLERPPDLDQPRNVQWALDLLKGYVESNRVSVQGKGGNNTAFQVAASILDKAISPAMCFDLLWEHWNPHCQPPWDDWELERVVRNASEYGEDTGKGAKGFQSNADAFAGFVASTPQTSDTPPPDRPRDKLMWLHDYADSVEDPTWLIPNVLPARGTGMMFGASGTYKSFLTLDMALCLAYGRPGQWGAPPVKNDVLFLAGEGPVATAKKRWPAWLEWQGVENREGHRIILKNRVPFYHDTEAWEHVKLDLAEMGAKPSLIVVDTLSRLLTGMDENSTKDATMVVGFMEALAHHYECFVLAVHHTGKDEKKGARGSSVFYANMDTVLATRLRGGGTELRVKKQKDADVPDEPQYFQVKEIGSSIVLEKADTLPEEPKAGKSRHDWAGSEEVASVLHSLGGRTSTAHLVQSIASDKGIDPAAVRKKLLASSELAWLRTDSNTWEIPQREYDL